MAKKILPFIFLLSLAGCNKTPVLNLYCWSEMMDPEVLKEFEKRHNCRVAVEYFASNEELFAKIKNIDPSRQIYDVMFPSDYMVSILIKEGLLEKLPSKEMDISNWKHLDAAFTNLYFDPGNLHSIPYQLGMTGLAWDSSRTDLDAKKISWELFLDPKFKGKISVLNDTREAFAVALRLAGMHPNETDPEKLQQAAQKLSALKLAAAAINSENFEYLLMNGDTMLAHAWNTNIIRLADHHPSLRFAIPKEGGVVWMDNMVIPKGAKNKAMAQAFLNFFMEPEIAKRNALYSKLATPNKAARTLLPEEMAQNSSIFPTASDLKNRLEWLKDLGPETSDLYERLWIQIKGE